MDISPEERRGEAVSLITLASYLGLTFGPVLADLVRGSDRYPLVWLVTAGLVLGATAVVATLRETKPATEEASSSSWLPPRGALRPGLLVVLGLLGFGGFIAFAAIYARDLGVERPGLIFALFGGVISLVRFFGRRLPDALGAIRTLELSFVCLAAGLALIGAWGTTTGLIVGTVIFAVGQAMTYPSAVLLAVQSTSAAERSAVVGSVGAAVDVALGCRRADAGCGREVLGLRRRVPRRLGGRTERAGRVVADAHEGGGYRGRTIDLTVESKALGARRLAVPSAVRRASGASAPWKPSPWPNRMCSGSSAASACRGGKRRRAGWTPNGSPDARK